MFEDSQHASIWWAAGLVAIGTLVLTQKTKVSSKKTIPGSFGWPIIGHLPYMSSHNPYPVLEYYANKYGPIFRLKLGSWDSVFVTDYNQIKRMLNNQDFTSRPDTFIFRVISLGGHGIVASNGSRWNEQRRFALRHLRDLGMGKSSIETHIHREIEAVTDLLNKSLGTPIDLNNTLNIAILDIVWAIVAGTRLEYDDPKFLKFMANIQRNTEVTTSFGLIGFIPWISKVFPAWLLGTASVFESLEQFFDYARELITEHRKTLNPADPRDYIDLFLLEQSRQGLDSTFTDTQLVATISDLFGAGGETTATTLRWAVLLISSHPKVQERLQREIDDILGKERLPALDDQAKMPYTSAVIAEVQRFADLLPLGVPHSNDRDVEFGGYLLKKNTMIVPSCGSCHRSPKYWKKPYEFYPEHFLDDSGNLRNNVEGFLPFLIGKRICLGERLARAELFTFIVSFFQKFNFQLGTDPKPTLEADPRSGMVRWPSPYKIILEAR